MQNPKLQKNALPPFKASLEHLYQYFGGVNTEFAKGFEKSKGQNLGHHKILESPLFF